MAYSSKSLAARELVMHIAILEEELPEMRLLASVLEGHISPESNAIVCTQFTDPRALKLSLCGDAHFDLLILDHNHEEFSGLALLRWLRSYQQSKVPVIMLSQRNSERDIAESLAAGADDFIAKPFRPIEMKARVERFRPKENMGLRSETFGKWTLIHDSSLVVLAGVPDHAFELSEREFSLAIALFRNLGRIVSRDELLEATNQIGRTINTRILDNQIFKMRKTLSLEDNGMTLQAVYAKGYRLVASHTALAPTSVPHHRLGVASKSSA